MAIIRATVYIGRDNAFVLTFRDAAGVPIDFSGIYALRFLLVGSGIAEADYTTLTAGSTLDTSLGTGQIKFKLGDLVGLGAGVFTMRLAYLTSSGDTYPTQLAHEEAPDVIRVRVAETAYD